LYLDRVIAGWLDRNFYSTCDESTADGNDMRRLVGETLVRLPPEVRGWVLGGDQHRIYAAQEEWGHWFPLSTWRHYNHLIYLAPCLRQASPDLVRYVVSHEIAHSWLGDDGTEAEVVDLCEAWGFLRGAPATSGRRA
jgi:hypothetical protein